MPLPMMTSSHDVMDMVNFLAGKPRGTTLTEALTELPRTLIEDRKMNAFLQWDVIKMDGDRIELSALGKDLNMISPENRYLVFQKLVHTTRLYKYAVDWMFQKGFNEVTNIEIASYWHMNYKDDVGSNDEHIMKSMATCFLQVCEAAHFGSLSAGKMSKTTHFKIDRGHLGRYYTDTSKILDRELRQESANVEALEAIKPPRPAGEVRQSVREFEPTPPVPTSAAAQAPVAAGGKTIFVSPSRNRQLLEQVRGMLEMEKQSYSMSSADEVTSILDIVKISSSMQSSVSGVVFVTGEESLPGEGGRYRVSPNKLVEIGAALAVFAGRVVLIWDDRVEVPAVLQGLQRINYTGTELSLNAGANLMSALKRFNNA